MRAEVLVALAAVACRPPAPASPAASGGALAPDLARIDDARSWRLVNAVAATTREDGRAVVRMAPVGGNGPGSNVALAIVDGAALAEGSIEVDLRGNGEAQASFVGVAFAVAGAAAYEAVYFRPFNFRAPDELHRGHAVQYIAWPRYTWERLRTDRPGVYEAPVAPVPDPAGWFHARIDVGATTVRVYVGGAVRPCLEVRRLGAGARGAVALWVDSQPAAFANLRIRVR